MGAHQLQPARSVQEAIRELDSLIAGGDAVERVVAFGQDAIPCLEQFLLDSRPRTISIPRCRAVRALGALGAFPVLVHYFEHFTIPRDAAVLFAEDAVRSVAAMELAPIHSEEVYRVLLDAARQRATGGIVQALGTFCRHESVPLLFELLEDDFCRNDALVELRKAPDAAQPYAILLLRGCTDTAIHGPAAARRRRSTLQLLGEFGVSSCDWPELQTYLSDEDLVVAAAQIGLSAASGPDKEEIVRALIDASARMNWAQEMRSCELLDEHAAVAQHVAREFMTTRSQSERQPKWHSPFWRTLYHILGNEFLQAR